MFGGVVSVEKADVAIVRLKGDRYGTVLASDQKQMGLIRLVMIVFVVCSEVERIMILIFVGKDF